MRFLRASRICIAKIMKNSILKLVFAVGGFCAAAGPSYSFTVVEAMHYKGGVDLRSAGVPKNGIVYESSLLPGKSDLLASDAEIEHVLEQEAIGPAPIIIDVEMWPVLSTDPLAQANNVANLRRLLGIIRHMRPDLQFGLYGVLPAHVYWPLVDSTRIKEKKEWLNASRLAEGQLGPLVDGVFPSLYTFYDAPSSWLVYAHATLEEAKRLRKPVFCFLWPKFHDSNILLRGKYIPRNFWRLQLETCWREADGIVLWNYEPTMSWDPQAPWWNETLSFLKSHGIGAATR
jgi:hypothetical protein